MYVIKLNHFKNENKQKIPVEISNSLYLSRSDSPILSYTFHESLNLDQFSTSITKTSTDILNEGIEEIFGKGLARGMQFIESVYEHKSENKIVWELSREGKKLLKADKVQWMRNKQTGDFLPAVINSKSKKIFEPLKGADPSKLAKLTKLSNIVVSAAHVISGADIVKELKLVGKNIDYLIASRKIDKISRLESHYNQAKSLLLYPNQKNMDILIFNLQKELTEIRCTLRNEMEYKLNQINDPKKFPYLKRKLTRTRTKDKNIYKELSKIEEDLNLLNYCYMYNVAFNQAFNFPNNTIDDELNRLQITKKIIEEKSGYISGRFIEFSTSKHYVYCNNLQLQHSYLINGNVNPIN
jgi:hypothetical protein